MFVHASNTTNTITGMKHLQAYIMKASALLNMKVMFNDAFIVTNGHEKIAK